jgi:hypothetical protein
MGTDREVVISYTISLDVADTATLRAARALDYMDPVSLRR